MTVGRSVMKKLFKYLQQLKQATKLEKQDKKLTLTYKKISIQEPDFYRSVCMLYANKTNKQLLKEKRTCENLHLDVSKT